MSELYLCAGDDGPESLVSLLASKGWEGRIDGFGNGMPIVAVPEPDERLLRFTAELLRSERLRSAGVFVQRLHPDDLYLAAEWWGGLVVEGDLVVQGDVFDGILVFEKAYEPRNLSILRIAPEAAHDVLHDESGDIGPIAAVRMRATEVLADPVRYYGEFTKAEVGGANALYAAGLEAAQERGLPAGEILVGDPAAFGFEVDAGENSIVRWRRDGVIAAEAAGFGLGHWDEAMQLYAAHGQELDLQDLQLRAEEWSHRGLRYGIAIIFKGLQDPPVAIPMGAVFQQPSIGSPMQTLGIAQPANVVVPAGATVPLILPAYCLNPSFLPPNGPVAPTPLLASAVSGPQGAVWDGISRRYRGQS
ncbi:hypothetical protein NDN16_17670 [Aureimonas altamirensis]|uniref:hypothetical protein n=1 Tax=Aureimonas altamirensis TaxID=370622 RepID=UPI002036E45D|nr:hypothetical protein [Aureimonas altamirensis]MCM2505499.1 hypothetical protein [Aureimonas altamirensis]